MEDWNFIYRTWSQPLYRYLYALCGNRHVAEELLQETFFQGLISLYRYRGGKFSTWLYSIARNTYLREVRRQGRITLAEGLPEIADPETPETVAEGKEQQQTIHQAIALLPEEQRQVVILRIYSELDYREIARILERSENWARVNFYRGKVRLAQLLGEREDE